MSSSRLRLQTPSRSCFSTLLPTHQEDEGSFSTAVWRQLLWSCFPRARSHNLPGPGKTERRGGGGVRGWGLGVGGCWSGAGSGSCQSRIRQMFRVAVAERARAFGPPIVLAALGTRSRAGPDRTSLCSGAVSARFFLLAQAHDVSVLPPSPRRTANCSMRDRRSWHRRSWASWFWPCGSAGTGSSRLGQAP